MIKGKSVFLKVLLTAIFLIMFSVNSTDNAKANTNDDKANTDIIITGEGINEQIDINTIMSALDNRVLADGDSFIVDGEFKFDCKITIKPAISSGISVRSVTNNYVATCYIYMYAFPDDQLIATILHSVNITFSDSGLVHINSGSLSVSTNAAAFSGNASGYQIMNTDGSYSMAAGLVQLYDSITQLYGYYAARVEISRGGSPNFTFEQITF